MQVFLFHEPIHLSASCLWRSRTQNGAKTSTHTVPGLAGEGDASCWCPIAKDTTQHHQDSTTAFPCSSVGWMQLLSLHLTQGTVLSGKAEAPKGSELARFTLWTWKYLSLTLHINGLECEHWPFFPFHWLLHKGLRKALPSSEAFSHVLFGLCQCTTVLAAQGSCSLFLLQQISVPADPQL